MLFYGKMVEHGAFKSYKETVLPSPPFWGWRHLNEHQLRQEMDLFFIATESYFMNLCTSHVVNDRPFSVG